MSENETPAGDTRKCPYCAEWIKTEAIVCRYCGRDVAPTVISDAEPPATSQGRIVEETSSKRKPWLIWVIVGVAVVVGAIVTVLLIRSPGGSGVPEVDAVADTWDQASPQLRSDVCRALTLPDGERALGDLATAYQELATATLEQYPDTFIDRDVKDASIWVLNIEYFTTYGFTQYLPLERGYYLSSRMSAKDREESMAKVESPYLGTLDNFPDPCAD